MWYMSFILVVGDVDGGFFDVVVFKIMRFRRLRRLMGSIFNWV